MLNFKSALSTFVFSSYIYGHGFYELSGMLMIRKNVNNDISKDSPIGSRDIPMQSPLGWCGKLELSAVALKRIWDLNGVAIIKAA